MFYKIQYAVGITLIVMGLAVLALTEKVDAAPLYVYQKTVIPEIDSTYTLGTTTKAWLNIYTDELCLAGDCKTAWPVGGGGGGGSDVNWTYDTTNNVLYSDGSSTTPTTTVRSLTFTASSTSSNSVFPWFTSTQATITSATTTNLFVDTVLSFAGTIGTAWSDFCTAITGGAGLCDGTDADTTYTAGDALTLTGNDIDFDGGTVPAGALGGTWGSPTVDDDGHAHTGTTLSGIDISSDTNLTGGVGLTLTGDDMACDTGSSSVFGCLTAADWAIFNNKVSSTSIDTSAELAALVTDETGSGSLVFSAGPSFTSTPTFQNLFVSTTGTSTLGYASTTALTVTNNAYLNTFTANSGTTTNATSTNLSVSGSIKLFGGAATTTATGLCVLLTGSAALCDGDDGGGGGAAASDEKWATSTDNVSIYPNAANKVAIGTSTPKNNIAFTVASVTPYMALTDTDGGTDQKHLQMGYQSGVFTIGTTSDSGTATSTSLTLRPGLPASLGIGTSTRAAGMEVAGTVYMHTLTTAAGTPSSICQNATTKEITVNAALTCTVSARDQKTNIYSYTDSALDLINKLNPSTFSYRDDLGRERLGFIADEVQAVDPRLGDAFENGEARSIDLPALVSLNTKAIQELAQEDDWENNWFWFAILILILVVTRQQFAINELRKP